jgi:hypothetical protein
MSIRITVKSAELRERSINTKKGVKPLFEQTAYAHTFDRNGQPHPFPEKIVLAIWGDREGKPEHAPYEPGEYTLAPSSFYVGGYAALEMAPRLVRVAASAARAA